MRTISYFGFKWRCRRGSAFWPHGDISKFWGMPLCRGGTRQGRGGEGTGGDGEQAEDRREVGLAGEKIEVRIAGGTRVWAGV